MKNGFGRYISYNDNYTKLLIGTYSRGDKNGLFQLIYEEENEEQDNVNSQILFTNTILVYSQDDNLIGFYKK